MARTVELGRAVLGCVDAPVQLWVSTLITVSPLTEWINLQDRKYDEVLDYLVSGVPWVCRGRDLHAVLEVTEHGEPLEPVQRKRLEAGVLNAPVWKQLNLRVSLPSVDEQALPDEHPNIRLNIDHCRAGNGESTSQQHRIGANVPAADLRSPEGVPVVGLDSVRLSMCVRSQARKRGNKRPKEVPTEPANSETLVEGDGFTSQIFKKTPPSTSTPDAETTLLSGDECNADEVLDASPALADRVPPSSTAGPVFAKELVRKRKRSVASAISTHCLPAGQMAIDTMAKLVDCAFRLSVCKGTPKLAQGVKLVTSAFSATLSEVCPALWGVHYLQAFSQRVRLLPTISHSLWRPQRKARSILLRKKLEQLVTHEGLSSSCVGHSADGIDPVDAVHAQLWRHSQIILCDRPAKAYRSFCSVDAPNDSSHSGTTPKSPPKEQQNLQPTAEFDDEILEPGPATLEDFVMENEHLDTTLNSVCGDQGLDIFDDDIDDDLLLAASAAEYDESATEALEEDMLDHETRGPPDNSCTSHPIESHSENWGLQTRPTHMNPVTNIILDAHEENLFEEEDMLDRGAHGAPDDSCTINPTESDENRDPQTTNHTHAHGPSHRHQPHLRYA
ncbi:hypothetical protein M011DRAFT_131926 [Sporormia fimetaria CBS 119925]|uniref:Uncharacterized protein n=1 Tax=Sporormia fimetaria CBS 119925 TaxID=1340428 RepID=A0A6A6V727_9PLEO|nr:hypothetical protein M011DRAFT_131926 [Sporormia fimetaria CBS 119925]